MKKITVVFSILIGFLVVTGVTLYYILSKLTYKFAGLNFSSPENDGVTTGISFPSINDIKEDLAINFTIFNASMFNFRISGFNLKVIDEFDIEVGSINRIDNIFVPKNGENIISVSLRNINTNRMVKDFLNGRIKNYKYTISGKLGGVLPFKYTGKAF